MSNQEQSDGPPENRPARQPILSERVFLGTGGRLRPIFRALLFFLVVFVINVEVGRVVFSATRNASMWAQLFWSSLSLVAAFLLLSWVFLRYADGRKFSTLGLSVRRGWGKQLSGGFALGVGLQLLIAAVFLATRTVNYSWGDTFDLLFWKRVAANLMLFALAAAVEELAFRGYGFQRLMDSIGTGGALVATSALFGLLHLGNPNATFFSMLNTILAGILLAMPYIRTRSMWMQIGLHWSWNFGMATIVSLPVSGLKFGANLFSARGTGPVWLTGGSYGPEGGAVVTLVCLAAILWFFLTRKLAPSPAIEEDLQ